MDNRSEQPPLFGPSDNTPVNIDSQIMGRGCVHSSNILNKRKIPETQKVFISSPLQAASVSEHLKLIVKFGVAEPV